MAKRTPKAVIVAARCDQNRKSFGIRFDEAGRNRWAATWAFKIKAGAAEREGYTSTRIRGVEMDEERYPGCPYCSAKGFWKCSCGAVHCWSQNYVKVKCSQCGARGTLGGDVEDLQAGSNV